MGIGEHPNFNYANQNGHNFFQSRRTLGNTTKSSLNRFSDPSGMLATGKKYVAFSIITDGTDPIDYDKDYFSSESDAQAYLDVMKSEDFHNKRIGVVCPITDEPEVETKIINQINTGNPNKEGGHEGALPGSTGNRDSSGPNYVERVLLLQKLYSLGLSEDILTP